MLNLEGNPTELKMTLKRGEGTFSYLIAPIQQFFLQMGTLILKMQLLSDVQGRCGPVDVAGIQHPSSMITGSADEACWAVQHLEGHMLSNLDLKGYIKNRH